MENQNDNAALAAPPAKQAGAFPPAHGSAPSFWPCECRNWARCLPIDLTKPMPNHHSACEHYNASLIPVWRHTHDGASYVSDRKPSPDECREAQECEVTITEEKMHRECYDQLKEFAGF